MTLTVLSIAVTLGRLALVGLAGRELLRAMTVPRGRMRRRHVVIGAVVLLGSLIRL